MLELVLEVPETRMHIPLATPGCILEHGQRDKAGNSGGGKLINQEWCDTSEANALGRSEGRAAGKPAANSAHPNGDGNWENGRPESSTSPGEGVPCWRGRSRGRAAVAAGTSSRPELPTLADEAGTRLQQRGQGDANEAELICIYYRATPRGSHNHRAGK